MAARSRRRPAIRVDRLDDRVTPSILGTFELDANTATGVLGSTGSTTASHDWDQVYADLQAAPPATTSGALASAFVTDPVNSNADDIFTGGGSKDTQGIQAGQWLFTASKPQAKNDITHAYAAAYTDPSNGHLLLYVGLDRYDNSGDATVGFWFFRNQAGQDPTVTTNGGHPFTGSHADGDILLVSDFTQGGSVSTIKVFRWTGDDATGFLVPVEAPAGTTYARVNSGSVPVAWPFLDKSRRTNPAAGEFLEGGVDLTALGLGSCFSNFLAETRSSQSPTATLSDFVLGSFNTCRLDLPNTATVSADGLPTLTSNEALITVVDGHELAGHSGAHVLQAAAPPATGSQKSSTIKLTAGVKRRLVWEAGKLMLTGTGPGLSGESWVGLIYSGTGRSTKVSLMRHN